MHIYFSCFIYGALIVMGDPMFYWGNTGAVWHEKPGKG